MTAYLRFTTAAIWFTFAPAALAAPCSGFIDVDDTSVFCPNVDWLKNRAITLGCTSTTQYCPTALVTRLAMAAFMNRLGTALTPAILYDDASGSALDLDNPPPTLCETAALAAATYPRTVNLSAMLSGQIGRQVQSSAFASCSRPTERRGHRWARCRRRRVAPTEWVNASVVKGNLPLVPATSYRFGLRVDRATGGGTGDLLGWNCQLRAIVTSRTGAASCPAEEREHASKFHGPAHLRVPLRRSPLQCTAPSLAAPCAGFTDVDDSSAFCPNVEWLKNRGVTLGCTSTTLYCPTDAVQRDAMAAFLDRLGNALVPVDRVEDGVSAPLNIDANPVICPTTAYTVAGAPRLAHGEAVFVAFSSASKSDFRCDSSSHRRTGNVMEPGFSRPRRNERTRDCLVDWRPAPPRDLAVGTTYLYALRISRAAGSSTTGDPGAWQCKLFVRLENRNSASSPFDEDD